jgi:hypothetical protein
MKCRAGSGHPTSHVWCNEFLGRTFDYAFMDEVFSNFCSF